MPNGNKDALQRHFDRRFAGGALQAHAGNALAVAEDLVDFAAQCKFDAAGFHFIHQLINQDRFSAEGIASMNECYFGGNVGEVKRFFDSSVAAAHDSNGLSAVKEAVASGAGGNTLALIGGFRGKPQIHGRSAGGGDQRVAGPNVTEVGCELEWTAGEVNILHEVVDHLGAEAFSLLLHLFHQVRSLNAFSSARPIVNFGRGHELAARFHAGNDDRFKVGACGIYRGGPASRTGTENDDFGVICLRHGALLFRKGLTSERPPAFQSRHSLEASRFGVCRMPAKDGATRTAMNE